jgi:hypothetical protein
MRLWRILEVTLIAAAAALLLAGNELSARWGRVLPREEDPNSGRIYPLNSHGTISYMTKGEKRLLDAMGIAGGLTVVAGALIEGWIDPFNRRRRRPNSGAES